MSIDATRPIPAAPPPEWALPRILDIRMRRVPYEPPKLHNFRSALLPQAQECTLSPPPHPVKSLVRCLRYCFQSLHSATASFDQSRFAGQVDCSTLSTIIQTACDSVFVACFAHRSACRMHLIRLHLACSAACITHNAPRYDGPSYMILM